MTAEKGFGLVLQQLRRDRQLSQEKLADASGCSRPYISLLETGRNSPSLSMLFQLAAALEIEPDEIVRRVRVRLGERRT